MPLGRGDAGLVADQAVAPGIGDADHEFVLPCPDPGTDVRQGGGVPNGVRCPGWRGIYDYTQIAAVAGVVAGTTHNLAIEGLFEYIDPAGEKAAALEADGYVKTDWGIDMVKEKGTLWDYNMLSGVELSDVPFYFHPIPLETLQQSKGNVTNGYGLPQQ